MRTWSDSKRDRAGAWLLGLLVGVVCLLAWFDNLLAEESVEFRFLPMLLGISGVLSLAVAQLLRDPLWKWCRRRAFFLFVIVVAISLSNPSHTQVYTPLGEAPSEIRGPRAQGALEEKDQPLVLIQTFRPVDKAWLLQALPETVHVRRSAASASSVLAAILLAGSIYRLVKGNRRRAKIACLVICINGIVLSWVGLYFQQEGGRDLLGQFQTPNSRFFGSFRYNNFWAGWTVIVIGTGVGLIKDFTRRRDRDPTPLWVLLFVLFIPPVFFSQSRTVFLFTIVIASYLSWRFLRKLMVLRRVKPKMTTWHPRGLFVSLATAIFCLCFAAFYLFETVYDELSGSANGGRMKDTTNQLAALRAGKMPFLRPALARDALKLAAQQPVFGWGLGSFEYAHPSVAGPEFLDDQFQRETSSCGRLIRSRYVHNDWAQALVELGLVGTGALLLFILQVVRSASAQTQSTSLSHYVMFGCCCTLFMGLWDAPLNNPSIQCLFGVSVALSLATRRQRKTSRSDSSDSFQALLDASWRDSSSKPRSNHRPVNARPGWSE